MNKTQQIQDAKNLLQFLSDELDALFVTWNETAALCNTEEEEYELERDLGNQMELLQRQYDDCLEWLKSEGAFRQS